MSLRLLKKNKLTLRREFRAFGRNSTRYIGSYIVVDVHPNNKNLTRLGVTVIRRYGKSHERNRFKRQAREAFRKCLPHLIQGFDLNIKPRYLAHFAKTEDICTDLIKFCKAN